MSGMSLEPISKKLSDLLNMKVLFNKNEINLEQVGLLMGGGELKVHSI